ncbi:MAG TPA: pyridoxamine 5'-phosphate oxidase [Porphyromonadaceae bacterium]|nr:pyridoxamine 5'-phosphate oxidase [Porphyromonadaceae bacterium]
MKKLSDFREEYTRGALEESAMLPDPVRQFEKWLHEAIESGMAEPNAMVLASVGGGGMPSARVVLLKEVTRRGFVFFTNYGSRKGRELGETPHAALVFDWHEIARQVRVEGTVEKLPADESDAYFRSRPESSRLGAWVSAQSRVIEGRETLDAALSEYAVRFGGGDIPRPDYWGGYVVCPSVMEFWQGRTNRLHDRIVYSLDSQGWAMQRLAP